MSSPNSSLSGQLTTVRAVILSPDSTLHYPEIKMLYTKRSSKCKMGGAGRMEFPGGEVKPGEQNLDVLVRNVFDKVGLRITIDPTEQPILKEEFRTIIDAKRNVAFKTLFYLAACLSSSLDLDPNEVVTATWINPCNMMEDPYLTATSRAATQTIVHSVNII